MVSTKVHCLTCKKKTDTLGLKVANGNPPTIKGKCSVCKRNKSQFTTRKALEGMGLLSMLGIDAPFIRQIPLVGDILG